MRQTLSKEFLGATFTYETEVNSEGASLWDSAIEHQFTEWVNNLFNNEPERFLIKFSVDTKTNNILNLLKNIFSKSEDEIIALLFTTFHQSVDGKITPFKPDLPHSLPKEVLLPPKAMRDLLALSGLTEMEPSEILSYAMFQMGCLANSRDDKMNKFWNKKIVSEINQSDIYLKTK